MIAASTGFAFARDEELAAQVDSYWWRQALMPPVHWRDEPAAVPPEQIRLFEGELERLQTSNSISEWPHVRPPPMTQKSVFELLANHQRPSWWSVADTDYTGYGDKWPDFVRIAQPLSDAELKVLGKRIAAFSLPAATQAPKLSGSDRGTRRWNGGAHERIVIAGPAVKEEVTTYRKNAGGGTQIRIPLPASSIPEQLYRWAARQGLPMRLSLGRNGNIGDAGPYLNEWQAIGSDLPLTIEARTSLPAWVVNVQGVFPARLVAFSTVGVNLPSGACLGSDWLELALDGDFRHPVWAVLLSPQDDLAVGATVKRLPIAGETAWRESKRSELELRWTDTTIPALRLAARRFDYVEATFRQAADGRYEPAGERVLGNAWGVQVFDADPPKTKPADERPAPLASSGSPRCPPP